MYKSFFQLQADPFNNSPDPRFLLMTPHAREALAAIRYGITARKGFIVITGEPGTGKTTLLRYALSTLDESRILTSYVFNPRLEVLDFLEFVLNDFGVTPTYRTKSSMLLQFNRWLVERYREGKTCVVVVDEAQHLPWELLEEVRLLTNLETSNEKLLQIVLSGQPEFEEKLRQIDARQLRQRITLSCRTLPLDPDQIGPYIDQRIQIAKSPVATAPDSQLPIFTPRVLRLIHQASRGIPRVVNLICEHAMIYSYVEHQHEISVATVQGVLGDLEIDGAPLFPPSQNHVDYSLPPDDDESWSAYKSSSHESASINGHGAVPVAETAQPEESVEVVADSAEHVTETTETSAVHADSNHDASTEKGSAQDSPTSEETNGTAQASATSEDTAQQDGKTSKSAPEKKAEVITTGGETR